MPKVNETVKLKPMVREIVKMAPWSSLHTNNILTYIVVGVISVILLVVLGKYVTTKFMIPRATWWPGKKTLKKSKTTENVSLRNMIESTDETEGPEFPARESP